jgi:hypothetical protein
MQDARPKPGFSELKRNLNAASVVMHEEKASSVGTSSSSGRSSLSHEELGVIAARALKLSKVRADTQATRCENSPLHHILAAKRTRKIFVEENPRQTKEQPQANIPHAYVSAQRLSERLTRAERFTALKMTRSKVRSQSEYGSAGSPTSSSSPEKSKHPVFGYSKRTFAVNTMDNDSNESSTPMSELSCVRRSKHLSKVMQQKADHFAGQSPTRRMKNAVGNTDHQMQRSKDPNPYFERSFAPQVYQPFRHGQLDEQDVTKSQSGRGTEQYRKRNYVPNDKPRYQHLSHPEKVNGIVQTNRHLSASKNDKQFSRPHSRFNYPPDSPISTGQIHQAPDPQRHQTESAFDGRRFRYNGDTDLPENSVKFLAREKWLQDPRRIDDGHNMHQDENQDSDQLKLIATATEAEYYGTDDSSGSAHTSDEERSLDLKPPQRLLRPTFEARGAAQNTKKSTLRPEKLTKDTLLDDHLMEMPQQRSEARRASGNSDTVSPRRREILSKQTSNKVGALDFAADRKSEVAALKQAHPSVQESRKGSESLILTDFSEDGPGTCGELSAQDQTYTGSLNKHEISTGSSDSSGSRPDAFQWLHQKYGTQAPVVADSAVHLAMSRVPRHVKSNTDNRTSQIEKIKADEEDDIFFGLEEESGYAEDEDGKYQKHEKLARLNNVRPSRIRTDRSQFEASQASVNPTASRPSAERFPIIQTQSTQINEAVKHSGKTIDKVCSNKSVTSDITSSLVAEKTRKAARYRPNPVDTIMEEPPVSATVDENEDEDDVSLDEESVQDDSKPSTSVLRDLSSAIVNSLQHACTIPGKTRSCSAIYRDKRTFTHQPDVEKMPDISACALNTKMKCEEKISEAWVGLGEEDEATYDDDATKTTFGMSEAGGGATEDMLNDVERRIWAAWDKREKNLSEKSSCMHQPDIDEPRQTSDSSSSNNTQTPAQHHERRLEAQSQLLNHVEKAMELYGTNAEQCASLSSESSASQMPKPIAAGDQTPWSRLSAALSFEQREVLEKFSSSLKNAGVEVLKLSRRNKWQVRYLTVSREVMRLNTEEEVTGNVGQCPRALLWPKQIKSQNHSVSCIKGNGRGGVLFENLKQVRSIASNEFYDRHLPRRLKSTFPTYAGVALDYRYKTGDRQLHFCFKTNQDAQAFVTAMLIIKEAAERAVPKGSKNIESYPTESSGTKSIEN